VQNVYIKRDEEKQKQKAKIMLSTLGQATGEKNTSQRAEYIVPKSLHRPQGERMKTNVIDGGSQDTSDNNVLKGKRKRG
jgi:hypothetical protein